MYGDCARFVFGSCQESIDDIIRGCGAVCKEKVKVLDALLSEFAFLILGLVKANNKSNTESLPNRDVVFWGE